MSSLRVSALAQSQPCQLQNLPRALWVSKLLSKPKPFRSTNFSKVSFSEKCKLRISLVPRSQAVADSDVVMERAQSLARETNVGEVARLLQESGESQVPDRFVVKNRAKHQFPLTPHDSFAELPVLDLGLVESDVERAVKEVGEAFVNFGFLQVINHNVPRELLREHEELAREFMALPAAVKNRGAFGRFVGYNGGISSEEIGMEQQAWVEAFNMTNSAYPMLDPVVGAIWPEGNSRVKAAFRNLEAEVRKLSGTMHELLALSLGLSKDSFTKLFDDKWAMTMRWCHYPRNPQPELVLGAEGHVDPNCLTLLYQDSVGGLQVKHKGQWMGVRPIDGAFVVNVGDIMQVLSNNRYMSVEHRVVTNSKQDRISVACFITPNVDATLSTPEELCTEETPRKYRPFTPKKYYEEVQTPQVFKLERDKIQQILGV